MRELEGVTFGKTSLDNVPCSRAFEGGGGGSVSSSSSTSTSCMESDGSRGVGLSCGNEGIDNMHTSGSMGMEGSMEPGFQRTPITAISSIGRKDNSTDGSVAKETGHCHLIFCESPERVEMKTVSDSKTLND